MSSVQFEPVFFSKYIGAAVVRNECDTQSVSLSATTAGSLAMGRTAAEKAKRELTDGLVKSVTSQFSQALECIITVCQS
jgi:hypothetical protein